jgi:hypothetical protein
MPMAAFFLSALSLVGLQIAEETHRRGDIQPRREVQKVQQWRGDNLRGQGDGVEAELRVALAHQTSDGDVLAGHTRICVVRRRGSRIPRSGDIKAIDPIAEGVVVIGLLGEVLVARHIVGHVEKVADSVSLAMGLVLSHRLLYPARHVVDDVRHEDLDGHQHVLDQHHRQESERIDKMVSAC